MTRNTIEPEEHLETGVIDTHTPDSIGQTDPSVIQGGVDTGLGPRDPDEDDDLLGDSATAGDLGTEGGY